MTIEELQQGFEMLRADGYSDEDLLRISHRMYADGKIDLDTLETFCAILGYEFTEEFKNKSEEEKKKEGDPSDELLKECGMTLNEARAMVAKMKKEYGGKEKTAWALNSLFVEGKITSNEMMLYCHILGYTYTDDFKDMTEEEKREYCSNVMRDDEDDGPLDITLKEAKEGVAHYRKKGMSDDEILSVFYGMYQKGDISFESMKMLADLLGYEIT